MQLNTNTALSSEEVIPLWESSEEVIPLWESSEEVIPLWESSEEVIPLWESSEEVIPLCSVAKSAELGYFNTVATGCFSCPRVEGTPIK